MTEAEELELLELEEEEARAAGAGPPPAPSKREAFLRGGAQGATAGFGDEAQGVIQTLVKPTASAPWYLKSPLMALAEATSGVPEAQRLAAAEVDAERDQRLASEGLGARLRRTLEEYRQAREGARAENRAAEEAHRGYYFGGNVAGGVLTAPALPGGQAKTLGQLVKSGAGLGAAGGLGASRADLTEGDVGQAAGDVALGSALGALGGAAAHYLPKLVPVVTGKGAELLERLGISQGRKVLRGGAGEIAARKPVSDEAVKRALEEGAIRFGGTTAGAAKRLAQLLDDAGDDYARAIAELEAAGVTGPAKEALVAALRGRAAGEAASTAGSNVPGYFTRIADDVATLPAPARIPGEMAVVPPRPPATVSESVGRRVADVAEGPTQRVGDMGEIIEVARPVPAAPMARPPSTRPVAVAPEVGEVIERPVERLGLTQAEKVKRSLQDAAEKEYQRVGGNTELGQAKMEAAATLREAVEEAVEAQAARAPEAAAAFLPVKQRFGELAEALKTATKGAARIANRKAIGLQDTVAAAGHADPAAKLGSLLLSLLSKSRGASAVASAANMGARALGGATELLQHPALAAGAEVARPLPLLGAAGRQLLARLRGERRPAEEDEERR